MWWLFYTLLTALFWGIGQIFVKKGLKETSSLFNNILSSSLGFLIFIPFSLYHGVNFELVPKIIPYTPIVAILFLAYFYIIGRGQLSLTGTVIGTYPLITVILSFLFLHEAPSLYQKLAIAIIILGTTFIALPDKLQKIKLGSWLGWALFGVVVTGVADFSIKLLLTQSDLYTYLFAYGIVSLPLTLLTILIDKKGRTMPAFTLKKYLPTLIGVTMIELGFFIFHIALSMGYASLVVPLSSIYVAITAVLAWVVLKERISKLQFLGIALCASGVVLVGIA